MSGAKKQCKINDIIVTPTATTETHIGENLALCTCTHDFEYPIFGGLQVHALFETNHKL